MKYTSITIYIHYLMNQLNILWSKEENDDDDRSYKYYIILKRKQYTDISNNMVVYWVTSDIKDECCYVKHFCWMYAHVYAFFIIWSRI